MGRPRNAVLDVKVSLDSQFDRPIVPRWVVAVMGLIVWLTTMTGGASAHVGDAEPTYRTRIIAVTPPGLPVDVRITDGDQIRFENLGDEDLVLCGYDTDRCEAWVRIGASGVFEDRNSPSWFANQSTIRAGEVPEGAGARPAKPVRVRRQPPFYAYHDHRAHWMGSALPPGVDTSDPKPQRVFDGDISFRYGATPGTVRTRLEYVGGRSFIQRWGETMLVVVAIGAMLALFIMDARRRARRLRPAGRAAVASVEPEHTA